MNQSPKFNNNHLESYDNFDLKKEFKKYLYYWKYFAFSTLLCFLISLIFLKYTQKVYYVEAKIKVLDKSETLLDLPTASELFSNSKINLENEIEILNSFPILSQVIQNKNLHTSVFEIGDIMESLSINYPFEIVYKHPVDSISKSVYNLILLT